MRNSIIAFALTLVSIPAFAVDFYVSPSGTPQGTGVKEAPFATVEQARDAIRTLKKAGPLPAEGVTVWLGGGDYFRDASVVFEAEDSGAEAAPIVYRGVAGETARFLGGRVLTADLFAAVTDPAVLERMDEQARTNARVVDLKALGITDLGEVPDNFENAPVLPEIIFNDHRLTLARWPNEGWAEIAKIVESGPAPWRKHESEALGAFEYGEDRPLRWLKAPEVWLHGYWCFDWSAESIKVKSIDTEKKLITLAKQHHYGIGHGNEGARRYYALNLLEEVDSPGEYFIDRHNGLLYVWPPADLATSRVVITMLKDPVFALNKVSNVTLQGFAVETTAGTGIIVTGGENVTIESCRVRNTGQGGINVREGLRHRVVACDIFDTGTEGLSVTGGDRKTLASSEHEVLNNHIYRVSQRQRTHAYNIHVVGVGVHIAHNELHEAPHQAIGLGGNDHLIEYNNIYSTGLETDDSGAFYMGRNPSERGNVIRYNYWHEIGSTRALGSAAVYFDDGTGGQTVFGNVFYKTSAGQFGAVFLHGGHDNVVDNNIFVDCTRAVGHAPWGDDGWNEWLTGDLWKERLYKEVDISSAIYLDAYPQLRDYMNSAKTPRVNYASRNVVIKCGALSSGNWDISDTLMLNFDPGFIDMANKNFALKHDSMVYRKIPGFEPIPFDRMGLIGNEARAAIPK